MEASGHEGKEPDPNVFFLQRVDVCTRVDGCNNSVSRGVHEPTVFLSHGVRAQAVLVSGEPCLLAVCSCGGRPGSAGPLRGVRVAAPRQPPSHVPGLEGAKHVQIVGPVTEFSEAD